MLIGAQSFPLKSCALIWVGRRLVPFQVDYCGRVREVRNRFRRLEAFQGRKRKEWWEAMMRSDIRFPKDSLNVDTTS